MRRRGRDFPFCCVVVLEILQYFCVLPPCKDKKSPSSAIEDFCGIHSPRRRAVLKFRGMSSPARLAVFLQAFSAKISDRRGGRFFFFLFCSSLWIFFSVDIFGYASVKNKQKAAGCLIKREYYKKN